MKSAPAYAHQAIRIVLEAFEGRLFFAPTPENKALLTFLLAHYAPEYKVDLNLVLILRDPTPPPRSVGLRDKRVGLRDRAG